MYCIRCGAKNDEDAKFCMICGNELVRGIRKEKRLKLGINFPILFKIISDILGKILDKTSYILRRILAAIIYIIKKIFGMLKRNRLPIIVSIFGVLLLITIVLYYKDVTNNTVEISISSTPPNASVYIDDIFKGNTPLVTYLSEGNYSLKLNITGYKSIRTYFDVTPDTAKQLINVTLEPIE